MCATISLPFSCSRSCGRISLSFCIQRMASLYLSSKLMLEELLMTGEIGNSSEFDHTMDLGSAKRS